MEYRKHGDMFSSKLFQSLPLALARNFVFEDSLSDRYFGGISSLGNQASHFPTERLFPLDNRRKIQIILRYGLSSLWAI